MSSSHSQKNHNKSSSSSKSWEDEEPFVNLNRKEYQNLCEVIDTIFSQYDTEGDGILTFDDLVRFFKETYHCRHDHKNRDEESERKISRHFSFNDDLEGTQKEAKQQEKSSKPIVLADIDFLYAIIKHYIGSINYQGEKFKDYAQAISKGQIKRIKEGLTIQKQVHEEWMQIRLDRVDLFYFFKEFITLRKCISDEEVQEAARKTKMVRKKLIEEKHGNSADRNKEQTILGVLQGLGSGRAETNEDHCLEGVTKIYKGERLYRNQNYESENLRAKHEEAENFLLRGFEYLFQKTSKKAQADEIIRAIFEYAAESFDRCLSIKRELYQENSPEMADTYKKIAEAYESKKKYKDSLQHLQSYLGIMTVLTGSESIEVEEILIKMVEICHRINDTEMEISYLERLKQIRQNLCKENNTVREYKFAYGECLEDLVEAYGKVQDEKNVDQNVKLALVVYSELLKEVKKEDDIVGIDGIIESINKKVEKLRKLQS